MRPTTRAMTPRRLAAIPVAGGTRQAIQSSGAEMAIDLRVARLGEAGPGASNAETGRRIGGRGSAARPLHAGGNFAARYLSTSTGVGLEITSVIRSGR
jgi:hypothetical protein